MDPTRTARLAEFRDWTAHHISGDEKGEAQIFLDHLFRAFGQPGVKEAGATCEQRIKKDNGATAFADCVWKPIVLIEMKKRGEDLSRHYRQAFDYWTRLVPGRPRYVVLCNFDQFHVYDFDVELDTPQDVVTLDELPGRYGPLAFLFPTREKPQFRVDRVAVTQKAADALALCYNKLELRRDVGQIKAQRFILQMLVALFSEDIGLLPKYFVAKLLDECTDPPAAFDLLSGLFLAMNTPTGVRGGRFKDVPYFNGGLFTEPAPIELADDEVRILRGACEYDWSKVSPHIFGTLFQHSMGADERHRLGAHYTTPSDIMKIVGPTITDPWRAAIRRADTMRELRGLQQRMHSFCVLDPACGSGNFLYVAYRELKRLEVELIDRMAEVSEAKFQRSQMGLGFVTSKQFFGIDIAPFAVELAKVTMTLAHKLAIDELHIEEDALPLDNLDKNFILADALITFPPGDEQAGLLPSKPYSTPWPKADVIIGNPPFLGAKKVCEKPRCSRLIGHGTDALSIGPHG